MRRSHFVEGKDELSRIMQTPGFRPSIRLHSSYIVPSLYERVQARDA